MSTRYKSIPELLLDLVREIGTERSFTTRELLPRVNKEFPSTTTNQISACLSFLRWKGVVKIIGKTRDDNYGGVKFHYKFTGEDEEWDFHHRSLGVKRSRGSSKARKITPEPDVPKLDLPAKYKMKAELVLPKEEKRTMKYRMIFDVESTKAETILSLLVGEVSNVRVTLSPCKSAPVQTQDPVMESVKMKLGSGSEGELAPVTIHDPSWKPVGPNRSSQEVTDNVDPFLVVDLSGTPKYVRGNGNRSVHQTRTGRIAIEIAKRFGRIDNPTMAKAMEANGFKARSAGGVLNKLTREGILRETNPGTFRLI